MYVHVRNMYMHVIPLQAELEWLKLQEKELRSKGADEQMPPLRKREQGLLKKLHHEQVCIPFYCMHAHALYMPIISATCIYIHTLCMYGVTGCLCCALGGDQGAEAGARGRPPGEDDDDAAAERDLQDAPLHPVLPPEDPALPTPLPGVHESRAQP